MQRLTHALALCGLIGGCSADPSPPATPPAAGGSAGSAGSAGSSGSSGSGGASTGGGANAGSGGSSGAAGQTPLELPFYVNAPGNYVKSGFMGDAGESVSAAPSEENPDGSCGAQRASASAGGDCDTFDIVPVAGGLGWQGVFYQFPANNWGSFPGRKIADGASQVRFSARASRPVAVKFQVGMCDAADLAGACPDGFFALPGAADLSGKVSVDTTWSEHTVDLAGADYAAGVRGGFSWSIANEDLQGDLTPLQLFIDDITWQ